MPGKNKKKSLTASPVKQSKPLAITKTDPGISKWALPLVLAGTALLYSNALQNGLTNFDDDYYIIKNPFLKDFSWDGIKAICSSFYGGNYNPLTTLTYLFEYTKFGLNPFPYHLLNVLLHLVNTWLVFKLSDKLSGKKITALVVCILFAVHPMHVESVAWVSERKDVLYTLFYISSILVYLKYHTLINATEYKSKYYLGSILLFTGALFSKSAAVTLPVLLLAIDVYQGRKIYTGLLLEKVPFIILSLVFGILNIVAQNAHGAINNLNAYNIVNRVFLFTSSVSFYIVKLFAPINLSVIHFYPDLYHGALPWLYYTSLPFLAIITWLAARKNAYRKEIVFGVSFFLVTISVMLQILAVGSSLASERYTYIPYIGIFYIAGQWIADKGINKYRNIVIVSFSLIVILFSVQTWQRIGVWENDETLFGDIIKKDTFHSNGISLSLFHRGSERKKKGDIEGALDDFTQSILFCPHYENAHFNRGLIYSEKRDFKLAIEDFNKVIELDPKLSIAYNFRGWAYYQSGDKQSAMHDYDKAISLDSANAEAHNNKGWAYFEAGDIASALLEYYKAISFDPKNILAYSNLAAIKTNTGDLKGAIEDYDSLIKFNPQDNEAYYTRAIDRLNLKDTPGACADWKKAAELGNANAAKFLRQYCQ